LPVRDQLLTGVLGSDLIGFQTYHDCRHFLSCCTRVLPIYAHAKGLVYFDRNVSVAIYPTGIIPAVWEQVMDTPELEEKKKELTKLFAGKKIIVSRDRLDLIKGIPQKLTAFDRFLTTYPEWKEKVVLFQICLPPREEKRSEAMQKLTSQVNEIVGTINGRQSTADFTPVHYLNKEISIVEMCALYMVADAALITPLRDGMNLTSHEYIICQKDKHSPLILSEFAGSAQSLGGAILVNPWDQEGLSKAIKEALVIAQQDKDTRHEHNYKYVKLHTALFWAKTFLRDFVKISHDQK